MNLLLHEMVIAAFHDVIHLHLQSLQNTGHCKGAVRMAHIEDAISTFAQVYHIIVFQHHYPAANVNSICML